MLLAADPKARVLPDCCAASLSGRRDRGSDYDRRGGEYDRRRDDYDSRRDRDRDYAPRRDDRGYGGGDDYRSRGREVAPPRDLYGGGGSGGGYRERDRYAEVSESGAA